MSNPPFSVIRLIVDELIQPFYAIERATPLPKRFGRHENDAEHSWGLALLACALAPQIDPKLDVGIICQFAVVHDLVEVYAGDTPNFAPEEEKAQKDERERLALQKLKTNFQAVPWVTSTIEQYEHQDTPEAHFVRSLDKTLSLLQEFASEGQIFHDYNITQADFRRMLKAHKKKAMLHKEAFEYYEAAEKLLLENPHFFSARRK